MLTGSAVVATQPPTATAADSCASLGACYDNVGISPDSDPSVANFDRHGNSYSQEALTAAGAARGAAINSSGMRFTFPDVPVGASDNTVAQGQTISLSGTADKLGFLLSASNGAATGTGTITYTDGSAQSYTLSSPDWLSTTPPSDGALAISTDRRNGPETSYPTSIFSQTVALTPGKSLASLALPPGGPLEPSSPALHIFDISSVTTSDASVAVTNPGNQTSVAGTPVNLQIQASDSDPEQTLTYSASGLPTGLSINPGTGLISGAPTTVATSTVTVTATHTAGATGSATFTWTVVAPTCRVTTKQAQYHKPVLGYYFYLVMIDITNTGNSAIPGRWNLKFTFGEERGIVRNPDGYVVSPTTGRNMTVTENKGVGINPRSTVTVSILTYYYSTKPTPAPPATFELNGKRCTR
ncbi:hypothetical protein E5671_00560 [Streptomyces sp. BA2]|nr:hypothetical protein [Streptomyces sp. BA2]